MEIILLQKVANLGNIGDRVKVKPGYGRNFLLPQGKATLATPDNIAKFEARRAELEKAAGDELSKAQAQKLAGTAHDGIARAVRPVHLLHDGDTVFALATGEHALDAANPLALNDILAAGADAVTRAIVRAVRAAWAVDGPGGAWPAYGELYGGGGSS